MECLEIIMGKIKWTEDRIRIMKDKYQKQGANIPELREVFSESAIHTKAYRLGLKYVFEQYKIPKKELEDLYNNKKLTLDKIAKHFGCSRWVIEDRCNKYEIKIRERATSLAFHPDYLKSVEISDNIQQILDGIMISDGSITMSNRQRKTARIIIPQTVKRRAWLEHLKSTFEKNGIKCSEITERIENPRGNPSEVSRLTTHSYKQFKNERDRWYPKGDKIIPRDINITPLFLAYWMMGDGSLPIRRTNSKGKKYYYIHLSTDCFEKKDIEFIAEKLHQVYGYRFIVHKGKYKDGSIYYTLQNNRQKEIKDFLIMTKPYMHKCFAPKWRALDDPHFGIDRVSHKFKC